LIINPKKKILPIFHLTNSSKVLFYARTAHLCASFLGSQEINIDVDHKGAPISTHREVDPDHGFRSGNKEKHGVIMTDTFKADTLNAARLPKSTLAWNLHGASADNVCRSTELKKRESSSTARNQPPVRVDSVSHCCSGVKVLRQGNTHTKIRGRDLRARTAKVHIEPKQDSRFFEHLGANSEIHVSTNK
jgi:hypothetical protein